MERDDLTHVHILRVKGIRIAMHVMGMKVSCDHMKATVCTMYESMRW